jgi:two-component system, chemotaxis family, CheB/CheR fusion protein
MKRRASDEDAVLPSATREDRSGTSALGSGREAPEGPPSTADPSARAHEGRRLADNTERRTPEEAHAHLAAIVQSSDDAIVSKNLDGIVQSWNQGAERIFGYSECEMVGQSIKRIVPEELHDEEERFLQALRDGKRIYHYETVRVRKDGRRIDVSLTISPVLGLDGRVIGASKIARDITEQKQVAEMLRDADRRKDQFLAVLAHELRNPLAALSSAVELLGMPDGAERLGTVRRIISRQTDQLVRMVDDLLDVSRITRGAVTLRKVMLNAAITINGAVETAMPFIERRRHRLHVDIANRRLLLEADAMRLEQMIVNLLSNAARYTEPGGDIRLSAWQEEGDIVISVRDNGIGIPAEILPNIFELFAQSERAPDMSPGGLGIGLTLVKSLADRHGGSVEARSEGRGKGSEFVIRLPAVEAGKSPDVRRAGKRESRRANGEARTVLLVDDNRDAAQLLALFLEASGHDVELAYDGPQAVRDAQALRPDAVLLDIGLPGMDGYEVARRIRNDPDLENVQLIAISGYCQSEDRERSRAAGIDHHLAKPPDHDELLSLLSRAGPASRP